MSIRDFTEIQKKLQKSLDDARYGHTVGVMYTAGCLAMAHGYDMEKAMFAGLLHDCAKCMSHEERVTLCRNHAVEISQSEMKNPSLLHAKAGAILAKEAYHITDSDILRAIAVHTTGIPDMSMLDKIIYIADYIEPGRDQAPNLAYLRKMAYRDLDSCIALISHDTLCYLQTKNYAIDPATEETYHFYKQYRKETDEIWKC